MFVQLPFLLLCFSLSRSIALTAVQLLSFFLFFCLISIDRPTKKDREKNASNIRSNEKCVRATVRERRKKKKKSSLDALTSGTKAMKKRAKKNKVKQILYLFVVVLKGNKTAKRIRTLSFITDISFSAAAAAVSLALPRSRPLGSSL